MTKPKPKTKANIASEYLQRYIDLSIKHNRTYSKRYIATVMQSENPDVFNDVEIARYMLRYVIYNINAKKKYQDIGTLFNLLPDSINELDNVEPFEIPTSVKSTLFLADTHGRFYDRKALEAAINYGIKKNCDSVILLGDICDCYSDSKFDKNPRLDVIYEEKEWGQDFLELLQNTFGYVVYKLGNHELRREKHIERIARTKPELMDMASYKDYMFYDGCTVNFVEDYNYIKYGKLNAIHGHEYYGGGINVARNRMLKAFDNVISAHSHITQQFHIRDIGGSPFSSTAIGCLCNLKPRYNPMNNWNHGFAHAYKEANGEFELSNKMIYNGKIF